MILIFTFSKTDNKGENYTFYTEISCKVDDVSLLNVLFFDIITNSYKEKK